MITASILKTFDPSLPTQTKTDASEVCVRVTLEQVHNGGWHVVAYASKMMDKHQKNYPTPGKKLYAIVFGIEKYGHLTEKHFTVITGQAALQYLLNLKEPQGQLNRWSLLCKSTTLQYRTDVKGFIRFRTY